MIDRSIFGFSFSAAFVLLPLLQTVLLAQTPDESHQNSAYMPLNI